VLWVVWVSDQNSIQTNKYGNELNKKLNKYKCPKNLSVLNKKLNVFIVANFECYIIFDSIITVTLQRDSGVNFYMWNAIVRMS
jgi:hypothetical protein